MSSCGLCHGKGRTPSGKSKCSRCKGTGGHIEQACPACRAGIINARGICAACGIGVGAGNAAYARRPWVGGRQQPSDDAHPDSISSQIRTKVDQ